MTQGVIGAFAGTFAYVLYHNYFNSQAVLNVPPQDAALYMLILIIFALLNITSALFLVKEE